MSLPNPPRRPAVPLHARLRSFLDLGLLAVALWLVLRPSGPLGGEIARRWHAHRIGAAAEARWGEVALQPGLPALGDGTGDGAVLVEFTDYRCPYCAAAQEGVDRVLAERPDARVVVRHLPVAALHPDAPLLARIAVCSGESGRFPEVHRALFRAPAGVDVAGLEHLLEEAGVPDPGAVTACAGGEEARRRVQADMALAGELGIQATPTFFGREGSGVGALPAERLREMLPPPDS